MHCSTASQVEHSTTIWSTHYHLIAVHTTQHCLLHHWWYVGKPCCALLLSKMSSFWNTLFLTFFDLDAGYPVYFYEFQHRPSSYAGIRPEYVRSDHGGEIGFVFGKPFLAGEVLMPPQGSDGHVFFSWEGTWAAIRSHNLGSDSAMGRLCSYRAEEQVGSMCARTQSV